MKKSWYDYLWIASLMYLVLGFFQILFAWLGLLCFFIPLIIAIVKGNKGYCNRYCGRGQLFELIGGRFGLSRRKDVPKWMKSKAFRYGFLIFFFAMFFQNNLQFSWIFVYKISRCFSGDTVAKNTNCWIVYQAILSDSILQRNKYSLQKGVEPNSAL